MMSVSDHTKEEAFMKYIRLFMNEKADDVTKAAADGLFLIEGWGIKKEKLCKLLNSTEFTESSCAQYCQIIEPLSTILRKSLSL